MRSVCVFCGSRSGILPLYAELAAATGRAIARAGLTLVYGGGKVGLMGAMADAALAAGGHVVGVMPRTLVEREIAHAGLTDIHVVETMHERKAKMAEVADAFVALPGGAGTLDEIFEQWTWSQLGIHAKPCGFLNASGYFDPLLTMITRMVAEGFMASEYAEMLVVADEPAALLAGLAHYVPPARKWASAATAP